MKNYCCFQWCVFPHHRWAPGHGAVGWCGQSRKSPITSANANVRDVLRRKQKKMEYYRRKKNVTKIFSNQKESSLFFLFLLTKWGTVKTNKKFHSISVNFREILLFFISTNFSSDER